MYSPTSAVSSAQADHDARALITDIEQVVKRHVPGATFATPDKGTAFCAEGSSEGLASTYLVGAHVPVPDAGWVAAERDLHALLSGRGYTERAVLRDQPGGHDVAYGAPGGAKVTFGSEKVVAFTVKTGCHRKD